MAYPTPLIDWIFDPANISGGVVSDLGSANYDGTISGANITQTTATGTNAVAGMPCLDFSGVTPANFSIQRVAGTGTSPRTSTGNMTVAVYWKPGVPTGSVSTSDQYGPHDCSGQAGISRAMGLASLAPAGTPGHASFLTTNTSNTTTNLTQGVNYQGVWHTMVGRYISGTGMRLFINASNVANVLPGGTPNRKLSGVAFAFGGLEPAFSNHGQQFLGQVARVTLWNTDISDAEVTDWHDETIAPPASDEYAARIGGGPFLRNSAFERGARCSALSPYNFRQRQIR